MRRRLRRPENQVELNMAAMLDMAFQLLAFFILTFRPSPVEGQIRLHMPPPRPITTLPNAEDPGDDPDNKNPVQGLNSLIINVFAGPSGGIGSIGVGSATLPDVNTLDARLRTLFADPGAGFNQVLIQASSDLSYQSLMDVVDVCTKQTMPNGEKLTRLGFGEIPNQPAQ